MPRRSSLLSEEVVNRAKEALKSLGKNRFIARKLEAIIAAEKHGITEVAKIYDITRMSLSSWIKHLKEDKLMRLKAPVERKRKNILNDEERAKIKDWINADPTLTILKVVFKVKQILGKEISKSTAHREIKKLRFSYITPRKQHYKKEPKLEAEFKKKSV